MAANNQNPTFIRYAKEIHAEILIDDTKVNSPGHPGKTRPESRNQTDLKVFSNHTIIKTIQQIKSRIKEIKEHPAPSFLYQAHSLLAHTHNPLRCWGGNH